MVTIIIKVTAGNISHKVVHESTTFEDMVSLAEFENFGQEIIVNENVDVYFPASDSRYALARISEGLPAIVVDEMTERQAEVVGNAILNAAYK